jgi:hypothetical protein
MPNRSSIKKVGQNELASRVASHATADAPKPHKKNPAAVALGRLGGLKGGKARAATLTPEERQRIALRAAEARWQKTK